MKSEENSRDYGEGPEKLNLLSRINLRGRFVFYVTVLVLIIMSLVAVTTITRERKNLIIARVHRGELLAEALYVICTEALVTGRTDTLKQFVERLHRVDELMSITLLDENGSTWWNHQFKPEPDSENSSEPMIYGEIMDMKYYFKLGDYLHIENPIFDSERKLLGTIRLKLSLAGVKEELSQSIRSINVIAIAAVLTTALLSVFLAQMILGPVGGISRAVAQVAAGDFEQRLDDSRSDELGEMARSFNAMTQALQGMADNSKLANIGKLAASVAHEIRNPLVTIRGLVEYLAESSDIPEDYRPDLKLILDETDRLNGFVQRLLDFTAPVERQDQSCDLKAIIEEVSPILRAQAKNQGVKLEKKLPSNAPYSGNAQEIKQVFFNLIFNAIQACGDEGRVMVTLNAEKVENKDIIYRVDVIDDGIGIPDELQSRIFDPFVTTKLGGTGLGLAITRKVVTAHGGSLKVVSAEGLGTRMTVILPFTEQKEGINRGNNEG